MRRGNHANRDHLRDIVSRSASTATAPAPIIGYAAAARVAEQARATGDRVADIADGLLPGHQVA